MKIKGKLGKVLLPLLLVTIFVVLPSVSLGALWVQNVALLPGTAVVFPSDAAAMDQFMAAALKPYYGDRVGICDGTNDHVEIQAALDAVRDVKLSPGQFNCEVTIDIDNSNQTLRGCGRNTILTTATAGLVFLSAVGGDGSELTGIVIADIQIDGGAVSDCGIYFEYVDYSFIQNVYSRRHTGSPPLFLSSGIYLLNSDFNTIANNLLQENFDGIHLESSNNNNISAIISLGNTNGAIYLNASDYNTITGNNCQGSAYGIFTEDSDSNAIVGNNIEANTTEGIMIFSGNSNTATSNVCIGNYDGIHLASTYNNAIIGNTCISSTRRGITLSPSNHNIISENICQGSGTAGIYLMDSHRNTFTGNICYENSQDANNTYDDIYLESCDYNNIQGNTCRAGGLANVPRYGINVSNAACDGNLVTNNDIHDDGFGTGSLNDDGTATVTVAGNRL